MALITASANGHAGVVVRLLRDTRVNPAARDQAALRVAKHKKHMEVVSVLLTDPRVVVDAGKTASGKGNKGDKGNSKGSMKQARAGRR